MERYKTGMLAISKAGHDEGRVYIIVGTDKTYVYLADGKIRTLNNPKKKKKKHVQIVCHEYNITGIDDVGIKHIIKEWNRNEE